MPVQPLQAFPASAKLRGDDLPPGTAGESVAGEDEQARVSRHERAEKRSRLGPSAHSSQREGGTPSHSRIRQTHNQGANSPYYGAGIHKGTWSAKLIAAETRLDGKYSDSEVEAAEAWDKAAMKDRGSLAHGGNLSRESMSSLKFSTVAEEEATVAAAEQAQFSVTMVAESAVEDTLTYAHTRQQQNVSKTSQYYGVSRATSKNGTKKWQALFRQGGERKLSILFDSEMEAALAWDAAARTHRGVLAHGGTFGLKHMTAWLNFPTAAERAGSHKSQDVSHAVKSAAVAVENAASSNDLDGSRVPPATLIPVAGTLRAVEQQEQCEATSAIWIDPSAGPQEVQQQKMSMPSPSKTPGAAATGGLREPSIRTLARTLC